MATMAAAASQPPRFSCVSCHAPTPTLYRRFGTAGSSSCTIKLTRCTKCRQVVDQYIEVGPLLVLIDLVLHRPQAYRHVLFNRPSSSRMAEVPRKLVVMAFYTAFIDALVQYITASMTTDLMPSDAGLLLVTDTNWLFVFLTAALEHVAFNGAALALCRARLPSFDVGRGYLALLFPMLFKCTAVVLFVWDEHATILVVVMLMVLSCQQLALSEVLGKGGLRQGGGSASVFSAGVIAFATCLRLAARLTCIYAAAGSQGGAGSGVYAAGLPASPLLLRALT